MGLGRVLPQHTYHQPRLRHFFPRLADQLRGKPINVQTYAGLSMRLGLRGDLTLKQASATNSILNARSRRRFQDPRRPFCLNTSKMVTKNDESEESVAATARKEGEGGKDEMKLSPAPVPPPPPERPELGDCCGSGCVRCVWDVYYEELEAYNRLYKSDSSDSGSKHA